MSELLKKIFKVKPKEDTQPVSDIITPQLQPTIYKPDVPIPTDPSIYRGRSSSTVEKVEK